MFSFPIEAISPVFLISRLIATVLQDTDAASKIPQVISLKHVRLLNADKDVITSTDFINIYERKGNTKNLKKQLYFNLAYINIPAT